MAGMGPPPKPAASRQRRNKTSTHAILRPMTDEELETAEIPELPPREQGWNYLTLEWWNDIWRSPMAPEFDDSDRHGLYALAMIVNDFWNAETAKDRQAAASEIRLQSVRFGLSPVDRRRLQWEIEKTEEAQDRGKRRRARAADDDRPPAPSPAPAGDPRRVLRSV